MAAATDQPWPRVLHLELTTRCNLRCPLCHSATRRRAMPAFFPLSAVERLVSSLESPPEHVNFYGVVGEPLLHPDLPAILRAVHGVRPARSRLSTNGMPLCGPVARALLDSPLQDLLVSLDGATAATYGQYRKGGDFETVCRNAEAFARLRDAEGRRTPVLVAQFIPMRHNEHEYEAFLALARDLGFDAVRVKVSRSVTKSEAFRPRADAFLPRPEAVEAGAPCALDEAYVDCEGHVHPCCHGAGVFASRQSEDLCLGNVYGDTWKGIRAGKALRRLRERLAGGDAPAVCRRKCLSGRLKDVRTVSL